MAMAFLRNVMRNCVKLIGGVMLGQTYYYFLLKQIPFPDHIGTLISLCLCVIFGIGNVISIQLRCISLLTLPMYCGKPGRSVLKALVLTHIVAGPISNMGLNAKEVVRVFACTTQLSYNMSKQKHDIIYKPLLQSVTGFEEQVEDVKEAFRSLNTALEPIKLEFENMEEVMRNRNENDFIDDLLSLLRRSEAIVRNYENSLSTMKNVHFYRMKLRLRCEAQLSKAILVCIKKFNKAYSACTNYLPRNLDSNICLTINFTNACDLISELKKNRTNVCDSQSLGPVLYEVDIMVKLQVPFSVQMGFKLLKKIQKEFNEMITKVHLNLTDVHTDKHKIFNVQDSNETARKVIQAFEEKTVIMRYIFTAMNIAMALIFLRIFNAAVNYHDLYLTDIDYDNVYITGYFKRLDMKRKTNKKISLLPLKKMERNKYINIHSLSVHASQRSKLVSQILKVMLEVVTATTFVMLDRLFFEALDVVRQHAEMELVHQNTRDLDVTVEGTGFLVSPIQKLLEGLNSCNKTHHIANSICLPRPRQMPYVYFFKIYAGYLWILLLLLINPFTLRVRRYICSYFYPRREKQRILHLYNDILKKRMKMDKTLRRKAVQAVRAHYLTGESLLSMRMKFPRLLGWLQILPAARMTCLICDEVEPRNNTRSRGHWYSCFTSKCPFVYCAECWREIGSRCLACDPSLAELSDVDSVSDYEKLPDT